MRGALASCVGMLSFVALALTLEEAALTGAPLYPSTTTRQKLLLLCSVLLLQDVPSWLVHQVLLYKS